MRLFEARRASLLGEWRHCGLSIPIQGRSALERKAIASKAEERGGR